MGAGAVATNDNREVKYKHLIHPGKWYNNPRLVRLNCCILLLLITSSTNGYDGSMMNGLQVLPQWTSAFNNPQGGTLGLLNAIQNIGSLAAYPFAPYMSDGLGRKKTIFFGACIMIVATVLQTASQSVGMFIGARFLIGFGLTFAANAAPLLVSEIAYPSQRAQLTSCYNSLWYSGAIVAAWSTFGTFKIKNSWSWRVPSALQALPSVAQVLFIWFVPESPRWLVSKGREAEARRLLGFWHANGNEEDPLVAYEYEEIRAAIELDRQVSSQSSYKTLFATPGNRRRLRIIIAIAFFSQWSGNGLVSYYLNKVFDTIGITDPTTQLGINGGLQIFNFIVAIVASFLVERAGRRPLFLISAAGMAVMFTLQTICSAEFALHNNKSAGNAVIAFIFLYYGFYDIAFTPLIVSYTVEILPYQIRAKGFNLFNFMISLSLIFNQYVNPIALKKLGWKYYIVYVAWDIFEFVFCYFFVVETKNRTLEETAALFDGADQELSQVAARQAGVVHDTDSAEEKYNPQGAYVNELPK